MKRVLCVSDEGVQLGKWRLRLGREGYVVVSALGVDEARSYARECRFDLVIMGLATPGQRTDDLARDCMRWAHRFWRSCETANTSSASQMTLCRLKTVRTRHLPKFCFVLRVRLEE